MERRRFWALTGVALAVLGAQGAPLAQTAAPPPAAAAAATALAEKPAFSQAQIEQMVAPIALYPDALLAQVLMSATYPAEEERVPAGGGARCGAARAALGPER
ncbi:MAG: DUF3300 domain-containing protein, partial [Gammaproteobacteria bacterium]|nr:DUF3300 domain-containing protein [Gammaproteobacteria bacterium]